jgi:hypothetical protein
MAFEGEPSEMSEAGELPIPGADDNDPSEGGVEEAGRDQDSEPPASGEQVEADSERDQAEG